MLCKTCSSGLDFIHRFRKRLLQTEKHVHAYMGRPNSCMPVNLSELTRQLTEHSVVIEDEIVSVSDETEETNGNCEHPQLIEEKPKEAVNDSSGIKSPNTVVRRRPSQRLDGIVAKIKKQAYYNGTECINHTIAEENLDKNMKQHNGKEKKVNVFALQGQYQCALCKFSTTEQSCLVVHMSTHTISVPIHCNKCSFITDNKQDLDIHLLDHNKHHDYRCLNCSYQSKYKSALARHMLVHIKKKYFECEKCNVLCSSSKSLEKHTKQHLLDKPLKCPQCFLIYFSKRELETHLNMHTPKKKKCVSCHFKTSSLFRMQEHEKIHKSENLGTSEWSSYKGILNDGGGQPSYRPNLNTTDDTDIDVEIIPEQNENNSSEANKITQNLFKKLNEDTGNTSSETFSDTDESSTSKYDEYEIVPNTDESDSDV